MNLQDKNCTFFIPLQFLLKQEGIRQNHSLIGTKKMGCSFEQPIIQTDSHSKLAFKNQF